MDPDRYYPSNRPVAGEARDNLFGWTIFILILIGLALTCWIGGYYLFAHPEQPLSYELLRKIGKLEDIERFEKTEGPAGEFLDAAELLERHTGMSPRELDALNAQLVRNYLRNYKRTPGLVLYATGRYTVRAAQQLGGGNVFPHGAVAIAQSEQAPDVFIEHVFPTLGAQGAAATRFLRPGMPLVLAKGDDLAAVLNVRRFDDGRLMFTVVPLLYWSYVVSKTGAGFGCEPPAELNLKAGWPVFAGAAELVASIPRRTGEQVAATQPEPGTMAEAPVAQLPEPEAPSEREASSQAVGEELPVEAPVELASGEPATTPSPVPDATLPDSRADAAAQALEEQAAAAASPMPVPGMPAAALETSDTGAAPVGGSWPVYPAGETPPGRQFGVADMESVAAGGLPPGTSYLSGNFEVVARGPDKAVIRTPSRPGGGQAGPPGGTAPLQPFLADDLGQRVRVIVDFPPGQPPPEAGTPMVRDTSRPLEILEVNRAGDGQINVYVREITAP